MKFLSNNRKIAFCLFVMPALAVYGVFILYCVVNAAIYLSFTEWSGISQVKKFVGFANYVEAFHDPVFLDSIKHTFIWIAIGLPIQILVGLALGAILASRQVHIVGRSIFRSVYFFPIMVVGVAVGLVWGVIYHPMYGLVNKTLELLALGVFRRQWLSDPTVALTSVVLVNSWRNVGLFVILFSAGLTQIPPSLYEAAYIDGAGIWVCFRHITLPSLRRIIVVTVVLSLTWGFTQFDMVWVMTRGGPGYYTNVLGTEIFLVAFSRFRMGYGSAIAVIGMILTLLIYFLIRTLGKKYQE